MIGMAIDAEDSASKRRRLTRDGGDDKQRDVGDDLDDEWADDLPAAAPATKQRAEERPVAKLPDENVRIADPGDFMEGVGGVADLLRKLMALSHLCQKCQRSSDVSETKGCPTSLPNKSMTCICGRMCRIGIGAGTASLEEDVVTNTSPGVRSR